MLNFCIQTAVPSLVDRIRVEEETNQVVRHQREGFAGDEGTLRQQS